MRLSDIVVTCVEYVECIYGLCDVVLNFVVTVK